VKDYADISYNKLFDASEILTNTTQKDKFLNKTTEIQKTNKSNLLKNSSNFQNHSYLSTPMILIQTPNKIKEKSIPKRNTIKDSKIELKYELTPSKTKPKTEKTQKNIKSLKKSYQKKNLLIAYITINSSFFNKIYLELKKLKQAMCMKEFLIKLWIEFR